MKKMTVASLTEELGKLTEVVQISQEKTDNTLSMIMNEIQEVRRSQEFLSSAYEELKNELQTVKSVNRDLQYQNTTLKEIVSTLKKQNEETDVKLNNLEQYSRRCCLEFQEITHQPSKCTDEIVVNLVKKCGINITSGDISISHRLAPPTKKYPNPIIIAKFNSQKLRNSSKRMKLKNVDRTMSGGSKLYTKESLTKLNKQIFSAALSSDVSESFLSSQSRVIVTSPSSQSHLKFFRVDSEP